MTRWLLPLFLTGLTVGGELVERQVVFSDVKFRVVRVAPKQVELVWKNVAGKPHRDFENVIRNYAEQGKRVTFIMNAGIFEPGGIPSGLHIEKGTRFSNVNLADAPGNFFLKPNGVCFLSSSGSRAASIETTQAWQDRGSEFFKTNVTWAIQSGPMLLIDGKRHPAFIRNSSNKLHRNGVGVDREGQLVFAITSPGEVVNFWDFSGMFSQLGCANAVFLDGDISQMQIDPKPGIKSNQFGAMFVVALPVD